MMDASAEVLSSGTPLGPGDPTTLGAYTMLRRLGAGGMGAVFLARGPGDRLVAVKVIRPEYAQIDEFRIRFRRETDNARRVARFCTAEVLDADPDGDKPYLVTEFVQGATLSQVVTESGPLTAANLERLAVGVAAALSAIHGAAILHRDLKPGNVMLSPFGPRVIDFGIARAADAVGGLTESSIGTPAFMAPEQLLGDPLTGAVDIFAWGAVVCYASTGNYPFGSSTDAQLYRIVQAPPDLSGLDPAGSLRPLVEWAMNKNPSARPSATELLLALLSNSGAAIPASPEQAVTQALSGWNPAAAESEPATQVTVQTPWYTSRPGPSTRPDVTGGPAQAHTDVHPRGAHPAAPVDPSIHWVAPAPPRPPVGPPGGPQGGPPGRPTEVVRSAVPPPPGQRSRRGRLIAAGAAVVIIAAAILVGIKLAGGSGSGTGRTAAGSPSRGQSGSSASSLSPSTSTSAGGSARAGAYPIPQSAQPLPSDTIAFSVGTGSKATLYTMHSDGSGVKPVGAGSPRDLAAISPDRRTIAFFVTGSNTLWVMAADGTGTRPVLRGAAAVLHPYGSDRTAWSPDGKSVAFAVYAGPSGPGLYVVELATGNFRSLGTQARVGKPSWSPKGDVIAYWSDPTTSGGPLYTIAVDGKSAPHQLTSGLDSEPSWSPDAARIAFQRRTASGGLDVWTMSANGAGQASLVAGTGRQVNANPSYSPAGDQIVFSSNRLGSSRLYAVPAGGGPVQLIPGQSLDATYPCWSVGPV